MSLDAVVAFAGPTLAGTDISSALPLEVRPPAMRGDVYRAALEEPRALLLIDGAFEEAPAVFHKEILWALAQGIHVFGAASIGALRAAELDAFGMVGHGAIYEAYRDGRIERDDAVTVLHGPTELGSPRLTVALVDMEASLAEAARAGILQVAEHRLLAQVAGRLFWRERTYERLMAECVGSGLAKKRAEKLSGWFDRSAISRKTEDALSLVRHVEAIWPELEEPFVASFRFEETDAWLQLKAEIDWERQGISPGAYEALARTLRARGDFDALELQALALCLAEDAEAAPADENDLGPAAAAFRAARGLARGVDVARWLDENGLSHPDYVALVRDTDRVQRLRARHGRRITTNVVRLLRSRGEMKL